jgi:hypothetical protein
MENKEITKWKFRKELKTMGVSCIGVKPNTVNKKVNAILKKYDELISYDEEDKNYYEKKYDKLSIRYNTLKSGIIKYSHFNTEGIIFLKDIQQIEVNSNGVLIILKSGKEIKCSKDFAYLTELF